MTTEILRDDGSLVELVPAGSTSVVDLGPKHMAAVVYPDGTIRFKHLCDRGQRGILVCAPALQLGPHGTGHQLAAADPLTITPSVLCPDCGTHGYITAGRWVPC